MFKIFQTTDDQPKASFRFHFSPNFGTDTSPPSSSKFQIVPAGSTTLKIAGWRHSQPYHFSQTIISSCHILVINTSNPPANQSPPKPHITHVPDFKDPHCHLHCLPGTCKKLFLDSDWIMPHLLCHVDSLFPSPGVIKNGTGSLTGQLFNKLVLLSSKKDTSLPLPSS
jgi:hypothetical protein